MLPLISRLLHMPFPLPGTPFLHLFPWLIPTHPSGLSLNVTSSGKLPWLHSQTMVGAPSLCTIAPYTYLWWLLSLYCTWLFDCLFLQPLSQGLGLLAYFCITRLKNIGTMDQWMDWWIIFIFSRVFFFPFWVLLLFLSIVLFQKPKEYDHPWDFWYILINCPQ